MGATVVVGADVVINVVAPSGVTFKDVCDIVVSDIAELADCTNAFVPGAELDSKLPKTSLIVV